MVLHLLTGLPPFIIADALVLLLGVTPAFGTVSPTSCKDGSRYMATRVVKKGRRKEEVVWLPCKNGTTHFPQTSVSLCQSSTNEPNTIDNWTAVLRQSFPIHKLRYHFQCISNLYNEVCAYICT